VVGAHLTLVQSWRWYGYRYSGR